MVKNLDDFRKMNCYGCRCENCYGACTNCVRCYRAEYAEDDWEDYYSTSIGYCACENDWD